MTALRRECRWARRRDGPWRDFVTESSQPPPSALQQWYWGFLGRQAQKRGKAHLTHGSSPEGWHLPGDTESARHSSHGTRTHHHQPLQGQHVHPVPTVQPIQYQPHIAFNMSVTAASIPSGWTRRFPLSTPTPVGPWGPEPRLPREKIWSPKL